MYLLYIDDSGTWKIKKDEVCNIDGGNSRYFVLGGILIKAEELNRIENNIINLKNDCLTDEFDEIKYSIKRNKLNCQYSCEKPIDKYCFKEKIANTLNTIDCTIFAAVQDKYYTTNNNIIKNKDDIYRLCFEHLLKSVDTFMFNNKISDSTITFIDKKDSNDHKDTIIYKAYKKALANNKIYKSFGNNIFSPTINIVYSRYTTGAQLADFVAGSVWSFYENSNNSSKQELSRKITKTYGAKVYTYENKKIGLSFCRNFLT